MSLRLGGKMKLKQIIAYILIFIGFAGFLFATIVSGVLFVCGVKEIYYYANFGWFGLVPCAIGLFMLE